MKKRKQILLNDMLFAEFKEKDQNLDLSFNPEGGDPSSKKNNEVISLANKGIAADPATSAPDFMMVSGSESCPDCVFNYTEQSLGGNGPIKHKPIHEEEEPQKAIMGITPPGLGSGETLALKVSNEEISDTVGISTLPQGYDVLRATLLIKVAVEVDGSYVTFFDPAAATYVTYVNTGNPDESIMLTHSNLKTFDQFRFSFLFLIP